MVPPAVRISIVDSVNKSTRATFKVIFHDIMSTHVVGVHAAPTMDNLLR